MKRRRVILIAAGCLVAVVVAVLVWPGEREPEYQGKKLSEWLVRAREFNGPQQREAANAVRQIGARAVPWLLWWTDVRDDIPPWKLRLLKWTKRFPSIQQAKTFARVMRIGSKPFDLVLAAEQGFEILGPKGRGAIPALTKRLNDPSQWRSNGAVRALSRIDPSQGRSSRAALALSHIGKDALPPLLSALDDESRSNRAWIAHCIGRIQNLGDEASKVVPILIRCAESDDKRLALAAVGALGKLRAAPELALPALRKTLHGTDGQLRVLAVRAIDGYGERAREAIPELIEALNSSDKSLSDEAANTLKRIHGEAVVHE